MDIQDRLAPESLAPSGYLRTDEAEKARERSRTAPRHLGSDGQCAFTCCGHRRPRLYRDTSLAPKGKVFLNAPLHLFENIPAGGIPERESLA